VSGLCFLAKGGRSDLSSAVQRTLRHLSQHHLTSPAFLQVIESGTSSRA
jgi:hypothetical protein